MMHDPINDFLFDFVNGKNDIDNSVLKFIGNPLERIKEDSLRILRGIRFASKYNFSIDIDSFNAMKDNIDLIKNVSMERVRQEIEKIIVLPNSSKAIRLMYDIGLLQIILPEVAILKGCEQNQIHHPEGDVFEHTLIALDAIRERNFITCFSILLHDIGKPKTLSIDDKGIIHNYAHDFIGSRMADSVLSRFKCSNEEKTKIIGIISDHMNIRNSSKMKNSTFEKYMNRSYFEELLEITYADSVSSRSDVLYIDDIRKRKESILNRPAIKVNGDYLILFGLKPSENFGNLLREINDKISDLVLTNKEEIDTFIIEKCKIFKEGC